MKTKIIFFTALIALSITGCKHPEPLEQISTLGASELGSNIAINKAVANPANPFDIAGEIHNRGLQILYDHTVSTGDTTMSGKREVARKFFKDQFGVEVQGESVPKLQEMILKDYRLVHRSLKMSPLAHSFVDEMNHNIDGIKSPNEFEEFKKKFIEIENQILRSKLSSFERDCLLKTAAVMRHSAYFWFNFANNNEKAMPMGLLRKIAGVITGIAADGTSALYFVFVSATFFQMLEESILTSEMCGFYTGGFNY